MTSYLAFLLTFISLTFSKPNYCTPSNLTCWPTVDEINEFESLLVGDLVQPNNNEDMEYETYVNMTQDLLYRNQFPAFFVIVEDVTDIQNAVKFAAKYNIQISILSTGKV